MTLLSHHAQFSQLLDSSKTYAVLWPSNSCQGDRTTFWHEGKYNDQVCSLGIVFNGSVIWHTYQHMNRPTHTAALSTHLLLLTPKMWNILIFVFLLADVFCSKCILFLLTFGPMLIHRNNSCWFLYKKRETEKLVLYKSVHLGLVESDNEDEGRDGSIQPDCFIYLLLKRCSDLMVRVLLCFLLFVRLKFFFPFNGKLGHL